MIDLDLLRGFLAVYRLNSVTKAAKLLALSQPALTARLQALEMKTGTALFERHGRGIRPTARARLLARTIGPYLDGLEVAFGTLDQAHGDPTGIIRIAAPVEVISYRFAPLLAPLIAAGVRPEFKLGPADDRVRLLVSGEVDLAILTTGDRDPSISTSRLWRERLLFVAAPSWAIKVFGRFGPDMADGDDAAPILAYSETLPVIRRYWSEVFGLEPGFQPALVLPDLRGLIAAAVAGAGLTIAPDYLCEAELARGQLVQLSPAVQAPHNTIELAWRRGREHTPTKMVRELILQTATPELVGASEISQMN